MNTDVLHQLLLALVGLAAWPLGILVIVIIVVTRVPAEHQPEVLLGIAELVRAVRGHPDTGRQRPKR